MSVSEFLAGFWSTFRYGLAVVVTVLPILAIIAIIEAVS